MPRLTSPWTMSSSSPTEEFRYGHSSSASTTALEMKGR